MDGSIFDDPIPYSSPVTSTHLEHNLHSDDLDGEGALVTLPREAGDRDALVTLPSVGTTPHGGEFGYYTVKVSIRVNFVQANDNVQA